MTAVQGRADRLVELLGERELDSLLVTDLVNVRYLTGFTGTHGACVLTPDERVFLTDFRYVEQAAGQVRGFEALPAGRDLAADLAIRLRGRAGFDDAGLSVRTHAKLLEKVGAGVELVAAGGLVERLRASRTGPSWPRSPPRRSWPRRLSSACSSAAWRAGTSAPWL